MIVLIVLRVVLCLPEAGHHLLLEASFRSDFLNPREDSGLLVPELTSDGL